MLVFNLDAGISEGRQLGDRETAVRMVIEGANDSALHFPKATAHLISPSLGDASPEEVSRREVWFGARRQGFGAKRFLERRNTCTTAGYLSKNRGVGRAGKQCHGASGLAGVRADPAMQFNAVITTERSRMTDRSERSWLTRRDKCKRAGTARKAGADAAAKRLLAKRGRGRKWSNAWGAWTKKRSADWQNCGIPACRRSRQISRP
jgi:hypothetical protein